MQTTWNNFTLILAQEAESARPGAPDNASGTSTVETTGADGSPGTDPTDGSNNPASNQSPFGIWIWLLPLMLVFLMLSMGGRKEKKKHAQMMAALGKGDKVRTAGGILGTVVDVRDDEIVVKVDESNNTKMRFARSAIAAITESKSSD